MDAKQFVKEHLPQGCSPTLDTIAELAEGYARLIVGGPLEGDSTADILETFKENLETPKTHKAKTICITLEGLEQITKSYAELKVLEVHEIINEHQKDYLANSKSTHPPTRRRALRAYIVLKRLENALAVKGN